MLLWTLIGEQALLHLILIPLDYLLSAWFCPVKVAKHPYQGKTLTGQSLAEIYWTSGIRIIVSRFRDAFLKAISSLISALVCCWNDLGIASFVLVSHYSCRMTYDYRIVPDHYGGCARPFRCDEVCVDEFFCELFLVCCTWYQEGAFCPFSLGEWILHRYLSVESVADSQSKQSNVSKNQWLNNYSVPYMDRWNVLWMLHQWLCTDSIFVEQNQNNRQ